MARRYARPPHQATLPVPRSPRASEQKRRKKTRRKAAPPRPWMNELHVDWARHLANLPACRCPQPTHGELSKETLYIFRSYKLSAPRCHKGVLQLQLNCVPGRIGGAGYPVSVWVIGVQRTRGQRWVVLVTPYNRLCGPAPSSLHERAFHLQINHTCIIGDTGYSGAVV